MFKDYFQSFLVMIGKHWLLRVTPYNVSMKSMCGLLYEKIACWWTLHILMNDSHIFLRGTKSMKLQYLRDSRCTCHHWRLSKKVVAMNGGHWWDVRRMIQTSTPTKLAAIMHFASIRCPGPPCGVLCGVHTLLLDRSCWIFWNWQHDLGESVVGCGLSRLRLLGACHCLICQYLSHFTTCICWDERSWRHHLVGFSTANQRTELQQMASNWYLLTIATYLWYILHVH